MTSMEAFKSLSVCLSAATAYISWKPIFSNVETYLLGKKILCTLTCGESFSQLITIKISIQSWASYPRLPNFSFINYVRCIGFGESNATFEGKMWKPRQDVQQYYPRLTQLPLFVLPYSLLFLALTASSSAMRCRSALAF